MKIKSAIQYFVIFFIGGIFLYFVFRKIEWNELSQKIAGAHFIWVLWGMAIGVFSHFLRALRATMLYKPLGYKVGVANSFYAVMIGYMMNYIIPRAGEVSRCAALQKTNDLPIEKSLGTVITERLVDLLMLALILGFVVLANFNIITDFIQYHQPSEANSGYTNLWVWLALFALMVFGVMLIMRKRLASIPAVQKIISLIKGFSEGLLSIKNVANPFLFITLSIGIWLCYILMMYFCLFALDATASLTFSNTLVVFAIGTLGIVIPAPAAGAGTYHFAVSQSLLLFGVAENDGIAYATLVHGVQMVVLIAIGGLCSIPVLFAGKHHNNETHR